MVNQYDYLIVGAGFYGTVFAYEATQRGYSCLVIDKRSHIGGNAYTENMGGINVHKYGAHIFHTSNKKIWEYMNSFVEFNRYTNSPIANYNGELYNMPFNMNTFYQLWGVSTPSEARSIIEQQRLEYAHITEPKNLEEQALVLAGRDIYEKLIKGYTEKQWGRPATKIPAFIIRRIPFRFTFDNNYFNDAFQGIPIGGYTKIFERMLYGIDIRLNENFFADRKSYGNLARKIVYTGKIDEYFDYKHGKLEYRSLHFESEMRNEKNFQGNAVVNYTNKDVPFTRIIEHKHFEFGTQPLTYITHEYPRKHTVGCEPYYPINDTANQEILAKYQLEANRLKNVVFGGRLAEYKYYDMHQIVENALNLVESIEVP
ncbi:MAG: UDP-galactopyranose mutase [Candidatus Scalindua sp.]|jgi:UDP-galactopyranose mutase|nr:UDP-galactopyranose mutase [Candidatus Scalindua sp.]